MPADRARPAAYIRAARGHDADLARHQNAVTQGARQRGWPPPTVYTEDETDLAAGHAPPSPASKPRSRPAATTRC